ncbi:DUF3341 domain-containing protein [Polyangium sp. 15x6]|uniref:DUF3341 domain-containing protein n=1 Tax=Polyangium sp. 15x6 TaxID=3042687 RepID=UPI002499D670|nr:DUF3341 domain-containing protein [Polyangium sp. 15x6]MDI3287977.1 DUF3341 domain-containing protein [Polyangium sp. 15x6]
MRRTQQSGIVGAFDTPEAIIRAAHELRKSGYRRLEGYTPYPLLDLERAIGRGRSRIGFVVFPFAIAAAAGAYLVQWWTNGVDYPLNAGGRPAHAPPAFVPATFEMAVLFSALSACVILAIWSGLPALWQPIFEVPGFEQASVDKFFLAISDRDPAFDREATARKLTELGASRVEPLGVHPATDAELDERLERREGEES